MSLRCIKQLNQCQNLNRQQRFETHSLSILPKSLQHKEQDTHLSCFCNGQHKNRHGRAAQVNQPTLESDIQTFSASCKYKMSCSFSREVLLVAALFICWQCTLTSASSTMVLPSGQTMWSTCVLTCCQVRSGVIRLAWEQNSYSCNQTAHLWSAP